MVPKHTRRSAGRKRSLPERRQRTGSGAVDSRAQRTEGDRERGIVGDSRDDSGGAAGHGVRVHRERPLWHPDGFYYFVDIQRSELHRFMLGKGPELVRANTGKGKGTTFDLQGRFVICEGGNRPVTRWSADGRSEILTDRCEGKRLNSPNDVVCKSDGSIYFTDPGLRVPPAKRAVPHRGLSDRRE